MPGTANGDPDSDLQAEGSLAGFDTIEALLEVRRPDSFAASPSVVGKTISCTVTWRLYRCAAGLAVLNALLLPGQMLLANSLTANFVVTEIYSRRQTC